MFRFTIRDVLWLTVVVAILAAWWIDRRRQAIEDGSFDGYYPVGDLVIPVAAEAQTPAP
jgi:hypothetical protein